MSEIQPQYSGSNSPKTPSWTGCQESLTQQHSVTSQKSRILGNAAARTSNHIKTCHIKNKDEQTFQMKQCCSIKKCRDLSLPSVNALQLRCQFDSSHPYLYAHKTRAKLGLCNSSRWVKCHINFLTKIYLWVHFVSCLSSPNNSECVQQTITQERNFLSITINIQLTHTHTHTHAPTNISSFFCHLQHTFTFYHS
jgi:hypothetical protein